MTIGLEHYLIVSSLLFCLGLLGVITRRNLLVIYMSLELMLNAANLALVAFSRFNHHNNLNGQVLVFFIITVAAAEVAVGLALIVALYRKRHTAQVEGLTSMKL
jgi:NADH-quinone oxidoreductase subunit K